MADNNEKAPALPPRPSSAVTNDVSPETTPRITPATAPTSSLSPTSSPTSAPVPAPAPAHAPLPTPAPASTSHQQPVPAPAATTTATTTTTTTTAPSLPILSSPPSKGFRQRLDAGEPRWRWKVALRALLLIVGIIGIGCAAFATSVAMSEKGPYEYAFDDAWSIPWTLITFCISVVWCATVILVLLFRKAPVHPGVVVSVDLILWLAYIPTALFAVVAVLSVQSWGEDGRLSSYSSSGYYVQATNGTWIWSAGGSSSSTARDCTLYSTYDYSNRYYEYGFKTCAEQDAYVNSLWESKGHRASIEIAIVVCQFIGLILHFALFVWACVDTHHRNSRKVSKDAEQLAADIVMNMVKNGAIIPAPSSGQRAPMQYSQMQQYPIQHPSSGTQQPIPWMSGAAGPSTARQQRSSIDKGESARYA